MSQAEEAAGPVIELTGVARTYPGPTPVEALKPADLRVERGDYVTIVGPSGAGKSTLLNVLGLLDRPTAGSYRLDGAETTALTPPATTRLRGSTLGFVFQSYHLLPRRPAAENVALGMLYQGIPATERLRLAKVALERVGLAHRAGHPARKLSGGEQQRVAVARAIVGNPSVVLCDEPTGNLDRPTGSGILDLLDELNQSGATLVVVTHDPEVAGRGNRRIRVVDGNLTEESM